MSLLTEEKIRSQFLAGIITEDEAVQQQAQARAGQQQPQQQAQQQQTQANQEKVQQAQAQADKNVEAQLKASMDSVIKNLPQTLMNFAKTAGDKDGNVEVKNEQGVAGEVVQTQVMNKPSGVIFYHNQEALDEAVGMLGAGMALSAPAILGFVGKGAKWLGSKLNNQWLQKVGGKVHKFSEKWHHFYEGAIFNVLKKVMPPDTSDEVLKQLSSVLFLAIVGSMGVAAGTSAATLAAKGQAGVAGVEGALAAVKSQEVLAAVGKALPRILGTYLA